MRIGDVCSTCLRAPILAHNSHIAVAGKYSKAKRGFITSHLSIHGGSSGNRGLPARAGENLNNIVLRILSSDRSCTDRSHLMHYLDLSGQIDHLLLTCMM